MMTANEEDADVEVRRVDQDMINEFGRLNNRKLEAREEIAEARKRQEELDDAEEGVMLADSDEGTIKILIGESFVDVDSDAATEFINARREKEVATVAALEAELARIASRQGELKKALYGRFGKSINLEDE